MNNNDSDSAKHDPAEKFKAIFTSGLHNKVGTVLAAFTAISLFFPFVDRGAMPLISGDSGKVLFVMFVILAIGFYGGINGVYIKVIATVTLAFMFFKLYDLFPLPRARMGFENMSVFSKIQWGAYVNVIAALAVAYISFMKEPQENKSTF